MQDKFVNVTDNRISDWQLIDWKKVEEDVQNLRYRIFEARRTGRMKDLKNLQKLMLRLRANWLLAIRRVTQINRGRRTPGIDREVITTGEQRIKLYDWLENLTINEWNPPPTRRVEIPKEKGKTRPLGIPTIRDRIIQAIVKNALEPEWEAIFEPTSYGFRPGRSTHDAIYNVWVAYSSRDKVQKDWVLDADIKGAFDNINHNYLIQKLGHFPARMLVKKWLKAGVMKGLDFSPTETGTPQGGIISPLLANIALHGMEEALDVKRDRRGSVTGPYKLIRYADDFIVQCRTKEDAERAKSILEDWLSQAGLEMSKEKTHIVNIWQGVDFLGFTIRKIKTNRNKRKFSVHTKPSQESIDKFKTKVRDIFKKGLHRSPARLIYELNPLIVGWAIYFRIGVSRKTFEALDSFIWRRSWRYAKRRHRGKGARWLIEKYYKNHNNFKWTFYDKETDINLRRLGTIGIERHIQVKGNASPDDPNLTEYWDTRRQRPKGPTKLHNRLWARQKGKCTHCEQWLDRNEELNIHHVNGDRKDNRLINLQLMHETCHHQITTASRRKLLVA